MSIRIRSPFSGWREVSRAQALDWARFKLRAITMGRTDEDRLDMVNDLLDGIQFTMIDLRGEVRV